MKLKKNNIFLKINRVVLICMITIFSLTFFISAKYTAKKEKNTYTTNTSFHISSDYLTNDGKVYSISNYKNGIIINLFNYEKNNPALVSDMNILYELETSDGWDVVVKNKNGEEINATEGKYLLDVLENGELNYHTIGFTRTQNSTSLEVTVKTSSPYSETISAAFNLIGTDNPSYTITDEKSYVTIDLETNNYNGNIDITWDSTLFAPDNTNSLMMDWINTNSSMKKTFLVSSQSIYRLIFFKMAEFDVTNISENGVKINLDKEE